jgi:hypothetical protein
LQAADGNLYGIVPLTNVNSFTGSYLFSFNPSNNQFNALYTLPTGYPTGLRTPPLVQGPDHKLYGVIANIYGDSAESQGILFSYNITDSIFTDLHNFTLADGTPQGGLLVDNGSIFGETVGDSGINNGQIYSYNIADSTFTTLTNFDSSTGVNPIGGLGHGRGAV